MNKTVLVTGASRGIGLAIAKKYADQGFNVAFTYVSENPKINETVEKVKGGNDIKVVAYQLNVTSVEQCEEVLAKIYEEFETIDVLVNNAGITKDMLSLKMKSEDFFAVVNTNLGGTFNISQLVVKKMMRAKTGSIINISSVIGITGNAGQVNYAASKAGIIAMTKSYAKEYGKKNVRFNAIAPGFIETDMTNELPETLKENILANVALNRFGQPEEVANVAYFLGSDESSFVNGQTIVVDGMMI